MINTLNKSNSLKSFDSFDLATLYTSIPHTLLIKCISKLIEEAYKVLPSFQWDIEVHFGLKVKLHIVRV